MKKYLLLLLFTTIAIAQNPTRFPYGVQITGGQTTTSTTSKIISQETNGTLNTIDAVNLPVSTATTNALELETTVSAGAVSGFALTNNGDGTVNIASGIAYLRATNDPYAPIIKYPIAAVTNLALTDNANNYVLVDYNGGSPTLTVTTNGSTINTQTNSLAFLIARVGNNLDYLSLVGQNVDPNAKLRIRFLNQEGIRRASGAVLGFSNRNLTLTSSVLFSGLIRINASAFNTASPDTFTLAYNNGSVWTRTTGQTQINNTEYNVSGTLTTMPNNTFRTDYVYLLPNNPSKLYVIMGNTTYGSLTLAKGAPRPSSLPVELQVLGLEVGRLFIEKNSAAISEVQSSFSNDFIGAAVPEHNSLTGLQGGTAGEYNHLTNAQVTLVNGSEQAANKATDFTTVNNTLYPSVQAVNTEIISSKNYVSVKDYGAVGDGVTDDTAAINSALTYCQTINGTLFFPSGDYLTTGNFVINSKISIKGEGEPLNIITDPLPTLFNAGSVNIISSSAVNNLFVVNVDGVSFENLTLSSSTTTSGAGIVFNKGNVARINNVGVRNFNINIDFINGTSWIITNSFLYNPISYNLRVNHALLPDGGDQAISNCDFFTGANMGITHILYKGGGGMKLNSCKFNQGGASGAMAKDCIKLINDVGATVDLLICNSSFENFTDTAIDLSPVFGFSNVVIDGNQIYGGGTPATNGLLLDSSLLSNVMVSNNVMSSLTNGVRHLQGSGIYVDGNNFESVTNKYISSSSFSEAIIPSKLVIGNGAATYVSNTYSGVSKTSSVSTVVSSYSSNDTSNQGLFFSLKGGATEANRYADISSYENGFGSLPLVLQNLGGNTLIGSNVDDGSGSRLQVNGGIKATTYTGGATLTGTPTAPTATAGTDTDQIATTKFVQTATSSGTFTPTITNGSNSSSAALVRASYIKTGNIVTAYYTISTTSTSPTAFVTVNATLPVNRTNSTSLDIGTGSAWVNTGGVTYVPVLGQSVSTTSINLSFKPTASVSCYLTASIQYSITE